MHKLKNVKKLYHGSPVQFEEIDLKKTKKYKDYGKGFYLTTLQVQATTWAQNSPYAGRLVYVYEYELVSKDFSELCIKELLKYDEEWFDIIVKCRSSDQELPYDVVYDRIADSRTADVVGQYIRDRMTREEALKILEWHGKGDQYCFKTEKAIGLLKRINVHTYERVGNKWHECK